MKAAVRVALFFVCAAGSWMLGHEYALQEQPEETYAVAVAKACIPDPKNPPHFTIGYTGKGRVRFVFTEKADAKK
jgi:hypothetical protein